MLTGYQAEVIAFLTDGGFVCFKHIADEHPDVWDDEDLPYWESIAALEEATGYSAYSRYSLEEFADGGLYCDECSDELVEDYSEEESQDPEDVEDDESELLAEQEADEIRRQAEVAAWHRA